MRVAANSVNLVRDYDSEWVRMILEEVGGTNDGSWSLLPYLFAAFMTSNIWSSTTFDVDTGGFNNSIHCLAKYIRAVILEVSLSGWKENIIGKVLSQMGKLLLLLILNYRADCQLKQAANYK